MRKALTVTGIIFAVMSMVILTSVVYAEEMTMKEAVAPVAVTISGEVVSVDVATSAIVVKQVKDPETKATEDVSITVAPETKILKGETALTLADLKAGDSVVVSKSVNAAGEEKVDSITVVTEANPAVK